MTRSWTLDCVPEVLRFPKEEFHLTEKLNRGSSRGKGEGLLVWQRSGPAGKG